ncbi:hypothetical protein [Micromonospora sp. NBC_01813]|uniref:hypothetical protein n=1 Tax=Micromonospora sp. NBC_01813 TaxID=2975988 RepID=UPI002DDA13E4|nr:hypothetical protein [Micromonospora sp. NBC_01813]WSA09617.1 hypothetical protein OG958_01995 [Micromonospora sp. NBC_01813]
MAPGQRLPTAYQPSPPVHHGTPPAPPGPGGIGWGGLPTSREECWRRLGPGVRRRVEERAGGWIDWWATDLTGRISAVVLGSHALVVVSPTASAAGGAAHEVLSVHLDPSSFRSGPVRYPDVGGGPAGASGPSGADASSVAMVTVRLDHTFASFVRVLPIRAQVLLQDPFRTAATPLRHDSYAVATGDVQSLGGATIRVWCYLTDLRTLTFCAGTGHGYVEGHGARHWELTVWRAAVVPRQRTRSSAVAPT